MKICICTPFRNASLYLGKYFEQVRQLQDLLDEQNHHLTLVIVHGDSIDCTKELILEACSSWANLILVECNHRGPRFASIISRMRFRQIAKVANAMWGRIPPDSEACIMLDGDLIWEPATMLRMVERLQEVPVVAPKVLHLKNPGYYKGEGPFWYDTFGFRRNGATFQNEPPWYPSLEHWAKNNGGLVQLDSAGACLAIRGEIAQGLSFPEEDVVVGFCRQIYNKKGTIWLDYDLSVYHP